jgi:hypothetical protein
MVEKWDSAQEVNLSPTWAILFARLEARIGGEPFATSSAEWQDKNRVFYICKSIKEY